MKEKNKPDLFGDSGELKKEFNVPSSKLMVATDEQIFALIRRRSAKTDGRLYAYLAGPIETRGDFGQAWRNGLTPLLIERHITPLDPVKCEAQKTGLPLGEGLKELHHLKRNRDFDKFRQLAGKIRYIDTNLIVHWASFIIMHIPLKKPTVSQEKLLGILSRRTDAFIGDLVAKAAEKGRKVSVREREIITRLMLRVFPGEILPEISNAMAYGEATGGTSSENQIAVMKDIPVLLVIEKEALETFSSTWVLDAVLENGKIFDDFEDLCEFLDNMLDRLQLGREL